MANKYNLPDFCYVTNEETGKTVTIMYGEAGYRDLKEPLQSEDPNILNKTLNVTPAMAKAMQVGSMFGWNVAGANPALYEKKEGIVNE